MSSPSECNSARTHSWSDDMICVLSACITAVLVKYGATHARLCMHVHTEETRSLRVSSMLKVVRACVRTACYAS